MGARFALPAAVLAVAAAVAGCNASALTKRELVVHFADTATQATHRAALDACAHATPEATPEPFTTSGPVSNQVGDVRFRIDHADDKAIATLETCLAKQPGVEGVDIPDLTD
ncbi:MAG TPA: hypothetical protein VG650_18055 [Mycobacteriales bacterium]|nr:hypothetical protein [Mycobacteriales bacterium]